MNMCPSMTLSTPARVVAKHAQRTHLRAAHVHVPQGGLLPRTRGAHKIRAAKLHGSRLQVKAHVESAANTKLDRDNVNALKPEITLDALNTLDLRVAYIKEARPISVDVTVTRGDQTRTRKKEVLELEVDIGTETRTIVTDIVHIMDAESAVGKKLLICANVEPTIEFGRPSHGKVIMGTNYDPTPMPRSFKEVLPGTGSLPPGSSYGLL